MITAAHVSCGPHCLRAAGRLQGCAGAAAGPRQGAVAALPRPAASHAPPSLLPQPSKRRRSRRRDHRRRLHPAPPGSQCVGDEYSFIKPGDRVVIGGWSTQDLYPEQGGPPSGADVRRVARTVVHPGYDADNGDAPNNDIALLVLDQPSRKTAIRTPPYTRARACARAPRGGPARGCACCLPPAPRAGWPRQPAAAGVLCCAVLLMVTNACARHPDRAPACLPACLLQRSRASRCRLARCST